MLEHRHINQHSLGVDIFEAYLDKYGETTTSLASNRTSKLSKPKFGQLAGFDHWREFNYFCSSSPLVQVMNELTKKNRNIADVAKPLVVAMLNGFKTSVSDALLIQQALGNLSGGDLDHFNEHRYRDIPVSLKCALDELYNLGPIKGRLTLNKYDSAYVFENMWDSLDGDTRLRVIAYVYPEFAEMEYHHISSVWSDLNEHLSDMENQNNWGCINRDYSTGVRALVLEVVKRQIVTLDDLMEFHKVVLCGHGSFFEKNCLFGSSDKVTRMAAFLWVFSKSLTKADIDALRFYDAHCKPASLIKEPRQIGYMLHMHEEPTESIAGLLRSNSALSAPVLATYMLYNNGSDSMSIERLYAIFYYLSKTPELTPLIKKLEPLARIEKTLTYNEGDLRSELIAATVLTRNASSLSGGKQGVFESYMGLLESIVKSGHYSLALREYARFIELSDLEIKPRRFMEVMEVCLKLIDDDCLAQLSQQDKNGIYLLGISLGVDVNRLEGFVSNELKINAMVFADESISKILENRSSMNSNDTDRYKDRQSVMDIMKALGSSATHYDTNRSLWSVIDPRLADLFMLSEPLLLDVDGEQLDLNKRMGTLLVGCGVYRHNRRGSNNGASPVIPSQVEDMPLRMQGVYEKLTSGGVRRTICSRELLVRMHMEGFSQSNIVELDEGWFAAKKSDVLYVYGSMFDEADVLDLLFEHRPNKIICVDTSLFYARSDESNNEHGSLHSFDKIIEFRSMDSVVERDINSLYKAYKELNLRQYHGKNPLGLLSARLAPKFEYLGVEFNIDGTDYFS